MAIAASGISAAVAAFRAATDVAKAMITARDVAAFQAQMIEFQSKIIEANEAALSAQEERTALLQRIGQLEREVADLKAWEAEKEKYELKRFDTMVAAYVLKSEAGPTGYTHHLCATCFETGKKSYFQGIPKESQRRRISTCPTCRVEVASRFYPVEEGGVRD